MAVTVNFECGGCFKQAKGTRFLQRHFHSFNGSGHGFGRWTYDTPEDVAPEGWQTFDPYTGACYCPECWHEIMAESAAE